MISLIYLPLLVICFFTLIALYRFWTCIDRMGFTREVSRRAPLLLQGDMIAFCASLAPFFLAAIDLLDVTLPGQLEPVPSGIAAFLSLASLGLCFYMLRSAGERITPNWEGSRESAIRTLAALRIIDATELAYAIKKPMKTTTAQGK